MFSQIPQEKETPEPAREAASLRWWPSVGSVEEIVVQNVQRLPEARRGLLADIGKINDYALRSCYNYIASYFGKPSKDRQPMVPRDRRRGHAELFVFPEK